MKLYFSSKQFEIGLWCTYHIPVCVRWFCWISFVDMVHNCPKHIRIMCRVVNYSFSSTLSPWLEKMIVSIFQIFVKIKSYWIETVCVPHLFIKLFELEPLHGVYRMYHLHYFSVSTNHINCYILASTNKLFFAIIFV